MTVGSQKAKSKVVGPVWKPSFKLKTSVNHRAQKILQASPENVVWMGWLVSLEFLGSDLAKTGGKRKQLCEEVWEKT